MKDIERWNPDRVKENRKKEIAEVTGYIEKFIGTYQDMEDSSKADPVMDADTINRLRSIEIPIKGRDIYEVGEEMVDTVFKTSQYVPNPKYYAFVPNSASPYSVAGSVMTDMYNVYAGADLFSQGAAIVEKKLISWLGSLAGFPKSCGGVFTSGGSMSTLTGMITARNNILDEEEWHLGTAYFSDQTHSSVKKGLMLMGLRRDQMRMIPSDEEFRIDTDILEKTIKEDIGKGLKPFLIIGTLGTTNTGSIDPFRKLGELRDRYGMWLHVDGAFGGSILFSDRYRGLADGVSIADSLTWDQHKWGLQTYVCSCIIARDRSKLVSTFAEHPEYLEDIQDTEHVDGWDLGIEMTRPARALKLWFTLQCIGSEKMGDMVDRTIHTMGVAEENIRTMDGWEITSPSMCGAVTFRYAPDSISSERLDELNAEIAQWVNDNTDAYIATTIIKGMKVIRICMINSSITDRDVLETCEYLRQAAEAVSQGGRG